VAARKSRGATKSRPGKRPKSSARNGAGSKARREFVSEAEEILERMREGLADLADQRAEGAEISPELVNRIFRSAHSLKGLAGMFGLDGVGELAHHMEDILDGLRLGRLSSDSAAVDLLDDGVLLFTRILQGLDKPENEEGYAAEIDSLMSRIDVSVSQPSVQADDLSALRLDPSLLRALTEYEEHRLRENMQRGRHLAQVDSLFDMATFEDGLSELSSAIREAGEVVSTLPSPGDAPESQIRFSLLVASDLAATQLADRLDLLGVEVSEVLAGSGTPAAVSGTGNGGSSPSVEQSGGTGTETSAPRDTPELQSLRSISETVRVDIRKLDELMNLVGELGR